MTIPDLGWGTRPCREAVVFDNLRPPGVPPVNLLAVSDPEVVTESDATAMYAGAFTVTARVRLVEARQVADDGPARGVEGDGRPGAGERWALRSRAPGRRRARTLARPPRGSFDSAGMGSPSHAVGTAGGEPRERLYYNGLDRLLPTPGTYAIGVLERTSGGDWARRPTPVLTGDAERPGVLEPTVWWAEGRWHMVHLSFVADPPLGEPPDYRLRYTWSEDGLDGWADPVELFDARHNFFDADVHPWRGGWLMVLAGDPHAERAPQGLWVTWSADPADAGAWRRNLTPLLTHDEDAPPWRRRGVYGPSIAGVQQDRLVVYASGRHGRIDWWAEARDRLARLRPPPVPAGDYYLSVVRLEWGADAPGAER